MQGGMEPWKKAAYAIDAVIVLAMAGLAWMAFSKYKKQKAQ